MTVEQRKIALIKLITSVDNESLLIRVEELIQSSKAKIPDTIMSLLELSDASPSWTEHKSVREFLK